MNEQELHEYTQWLMEVWNPNQLYIPFAVDAPKAYLRHKTEQLTIPDVSVAKRKLCPTCGSDSLITLSDVTYCMNDCCDGVKGHN
jgi:hypothetical protein